MRDRGPVFDTSRLGLALLDDGKSHERRAVVVRPRNGEGGLRAGDEPLVGVHPLVGDRGDLSRVLEQPGDELACDRGERTIVARRSKKAFSPSAKEREVRVHARTLDTCEGLRHERWRGRLAP